jgi:hypothetical protein
MRIRGRRAPAPGRPSEWTNRDRQSILSFFPPPLPPPPPPPTTTLPRVSLSSLSRSGFHLTLDIPPLSCHLHPSIGNSPFLF